MQCQCIQHFGQPLQAQDRSDLIPQGSEVILEVVAAGVCHTDLNMRQGGLDLGHGQRLDYAERGIELPLVVGHETVGRIVAVGPEAGDLDLAKTYVIYPWCGCGTCDSCLAGDEHLCNAQQFLGIHVDGGYASHIRVAHPRYLFDIGDLDPAQAAPLACSGLTTFASLKKLGDSPYRQPALLIGAGGLGLMCVQLMQTLGMKAPVVADISAEKRQVALEAGASAVIDPQSPDAVQEIAKACGGAPDAVIDFVGVETTAALGFNALNKGGTLVTVGLFGGAAPWALPLITLKSAHIIGSYVGSLPEFAELMELACKGAIRPIPTQKFSLAQADAVMDRLHAGEIVGRAVLAPA